MFGNLNAYNIDVSEHFLYDIDDYLSENPNAQDENGNAVLHKFIINRERDPEILQNIINNGARLEIRNSTGKTAFLLAVIQRNKTVIEKLIENGANVHAVDNRGQNAIHYMALPELNKFFQKLKYCILPEFQKELFDFQDTFTILEMLFNLGVHVNLMNSRNETPLMWAARGCHLKIVKMLLEHGANVRVENIGSCTSLHFACTPNPVNEKQWQQSNSDIMSELLRNEAPVNCFNGQSRTPLGCILFSDHPNRAYFASEFIKVATLVHWNTEQSFYVTQSRLLSNLPIDLLMSQHAQACVIEIGRMRSFRLSKESNLCQFALRGLTNTEQRIAYQVRTKVLGILLEEFACRREIFPIYHDFILSYFDIQFLREKLMRVHFSSKSEGPAISLPVYEKYFIGSLLEFHDLLNVLKASVLQTTS